ncbi:uracil phosphoribosyltransferase [Dietzia aerolata]|uniref:Uracil phosphoribosyltransferase n=1 Tax=Dietzia aerolata TaxID=595984 RepID=A0ABV5JMI6_9ACTN|nr:uracil phosphoribosyltransferase [Dietzia aerolata]MBB0969410.1 uracil phosphoribosyltransferase [Dietzia aerolata]HIW69133.1 uracil phosphoribosyltransferase [Candidatus Dietzia merdigallinarum]
MDIIVVDHPLVGDRLRTLRDSATDTAGFRAAMDALGTMLCYEAFRSVPTVEVPVTTPVTTTTGVAVDGSPLIVPVLRAGLGLLEPATRLLPGAQVGFIGLARDEESHEPVSYLCSLPDDLAGRHVVVLDPMLATGGSLVNTLETLTGRGATDITVVTVLCAPEGVDLVRASGLAATLVTATIDEKLNEDAFIVPGLGDAGDRLFGPR